MVIKSELSLDTDIDAMGCPAPPHVLSRLGDKWTILVLLRLGHADGNRLRFSELKRGVDGISQRMLTQTLRSLESNGLVVRHYHPEIPPRVEYELSGWGKDMQEPLRHFTDWANENWRQIEKFRATFRARERKP